MMNAQDVVQAAVEISDSEERETFIRQACRGDDSLREEVIGMMEAEGFETELGDVENEASGKQLSTTQSVLILGVALVIGAAGYLYYVKQSDGLSDAEKHAFLKQTETESASP